MNGGDFYLFANDGEQVKYRNGYGISNESPKANPTSAIIGEPTIERNGMHLSATFTRTWSPASEFNVALDGGSVFVMVARGTNNNLDEYHAERFVDLSDAINLLDHERTPPPTTPSAPSTTTTTSTSVVTSHSSSSSSVSGGTTLSEDTSSVEPTTTVDIVLITLFIVLLVLALGVTMFLLNRPSVQA
eukprot:CAMPEP_0168582990 /NCGR_PEP_ID=MMETSP0420-20121227/2301_1 /TAXON_ID=498008 /ORGANISM="Pessonella sp." /LENGTH=187 /DNA_ID=CAMNT_0008617563 /DNA_START=330 /DNA_END=893 /DNA_ORIENTATION=-